MRVWPKQEGKHFPSLPLFWKANFWERFGVASVDSADISEMLKLVVK